MMEAVRSSRMEETITSLKPKQIALRFDPAWFVICILWWSKSIRLEHTVTQGAESQSQPSFEQQGAGYPEYRG